MRARVSRLHNFSQLIDGVWRHSLVKHGVAVWTYGSEILDGIDHIGLSEFGQRHYMVYVNESLAKYPVCGLKIKATGLTTQPIMFDGFGASLRVSLIAVDQYTLHCPFAILFRLTTSSGKGCVSPLVMIVKPLASRMRKHLDFRPPLKSYGPRGVPLILPAAKPITAFGA